MFLFLTMTYTTYYSSIIYNTQFLFFQDILKQATEDNLTSASELPYFEGDFWPNVLEESIKELDQEEEEKRKQEANAAAAAEAAARAAAASSDANGEGEDSMDVSIVSMNFHCQ